MKRIERTNQLLEDNCVYDYIILGGGIAGLQVAQILAQERCNFCIVQAQSSVGGRIQTVPICEIAGVKNIPWVQANAKALQQASLEKGATWIQQGHTAIIQLCSLWEIRLVQQFAKGPTTVFIDSKSYTDEQLMRHPIYGPQIRRVISLIDELAQQYNRELLSRIQKPTERGIQLLRKYDKMTVAQFLKQTIKDQLQVVRDIFDNFFEHTECFACHLNSMHEILTKHARSNDLGIMKEHLGLNTKEQASYVIAGGTSTIIKCLLQRLKSLINRPLNVVIKDKMKVLTVDNRYANYAIVVGENIQTGTIFKLKTKKVVCAVPIAVCKQIAFTNVCESKKIVFDNQVQTGCIKSFLVCKTPFWRAFATGDGLFSKEHCVNMSHDVSPQNQSCGIMVFFRSGVKQDQWQRRFQLKQVEHQYQNKKKYIVDLMCRMYSISAKDAEEYFQDCFYYESSYVNNQYIRSGFQSNTRLNTFNYLLDAKLDLNGFYKDEHLLTFVGSQFSHKFASYLQGAIRSARTKTYAMLEKVDPIASTQKENKQI